MPRVKIFYGWIILAALFVTSFIMSGAGFSFGVFILPMSRDLDWSISSITLAISIRSLLFGLAQPFAGPLVTKFGPRKMITVGMIIMGLNTFFLATIQEKWQFYLMFGVVATLGAASGGLGAVSQMVSRWFKRRRTLALAIANTGTSAGQMVMVPFITAFMLPQGWRFSYMVLGGMVALLAAPLALGVFRNDPAEMGYAPDGEPLPQGKDNPSTKARAIAATVPGQAMAVAKTKFTSIARDVLTSRTFWLVSIGYFVCGFTTAGFQTIYLVPHAVHEVGMSETAAGMALGVMGGASILGVLAAGFLGDRFGKKTPLGVIYFVRGLSFLLVMQATTEWQIYAAAIVMGVSFMATVPLVTAIMADSFGYISVATLVGVMFSIHQGGSAVGAVFGGRIMDTFGGSLRWGWFGGALLLFIAAAVSFMIKERKP